MQTKLDRIKANDPSITKIEIYHSYSTLYTEGYTYINSEWREFKDYIVAINKNTVIQNIRFIADSRDYRLRDIIINKSLDSLLIYRCTNKELQDIQKYCAHVKSFFLINPLCTSQGYKYMPKNMSWMLIGLDSKMDTKTFKQIIKHTDAPYINLNCSFEDYVAVTQEIIQNYTIYISLLRSGFDIFNLLINHSERNKANRLCREELIFSLL